MHLPEKFRYEDKQIVTEILLGYIKTSLSSYCCTFETLYFRPIPQIQDQEFMTACLKQKVDQDQDQESVTAYLKQEVDQVQDQD